MFYTHLESSLNILPNNLKKQCKLKQVDFAICGIKMFVVKDYLKKNRRPVEESQKR